MIIELNGTGTASLGDRARELITNGVDGSEELVWTRGGVPISPTTFSASRWANTYVQEGSNGRFPKSRPLDSDLPYVKI